ncbi:MAG TPA: DUF1566 domain-containing protein [Burkholderiaceae bacterium]|nr:DUF1566 domain-containing protein [Burkholderiaceae bacterium]
MNLYQQRLLALAACSMLLACSGGGDSEATADTTSGTASTPSAADPAAPAPAACTAAPIGATGYSLVFKGCDAANEATYYDKSECVRDNATGLIWQGQTPAGTGLRSNNAFKTNYDNITKAQKWNGATYVFPNQADLDNSSNSLGFKNSINASNLCGFNNWRIPTKDELLSIVKLSEYPTIDNAWFPNTYDWTYWSSSPVTGTDSESYVVRFYTGGVSKHVRDDSSSLPLVRLVR